MSTAFLCAVLMPVNLGYFDFKSAYWSFGDSFAHFTQKKPFYGTSIA
jgi:hypothetical protein